MTVDGKDHVHLVKESQPEDILCSEMEMDENENGVIGCTDGSAGFEGEMGEESNVVFSREAPILTKGSLISRGHCCGSKVRSKSSELMESEIQRKDKNKQEKKTQ